MDSYGAVWMDADRADGEPFLARGRDRATDAGLGKGEDLVTTTLALSCCSHVTDSWRMT
jgi:hypothetical protein